MEFLLFFIAAGIIFYLVKSFKIYLSNPLTPLDSESSFTQKQDIPVQEVILNPKEKLKISEYGILMRILGRLSYADGKSCLLEQKLIEGIVEDMAKDSLQPESLFLEIYRESGSEDIQELAMLFRDETIGQYKKRVKIIEFMFALAYADGYFAQQEEECIIDVAAILEIENNDFNQLYDEFKAINEKDSTTTMDLQRALLLLGLTDDFDSKQLNDAMDTLFREKQQHILDHKNLTKPYNQSSAKDLQEISRAYAFLSEYLSAKQNQPKVKEDDKSQ
ncbi:hypothetical protein CQA66_01695 [Helicobacter aurati]|uniref:Co-chaperone DjlA N-terminal domain-containing protein n=1 Tax=Helicobacter aurati TaxID=137778 RepID=A0A3D8J7L1_9HELI|nr:TerB family tellurite resistance protein [Helicobacter aurati]RDU73402.1 hypothetical protein CQA66_01695 [Helicobacter aurati]